LLDGEEVYNSGEMTPGMTDTILLDVSGMDLLELITENNGDYMYDHTDWADARLIKYATEGTRGAFGTYYLRARYYQPTMGRFMSEDSIRSGLNWYTYCANNPIIFIDPLGLALLRQYVDDNKGTVTWDDKTKTATATVNGITRSFTAGTYGIFINSNSRIDVPDDILAAAFTKASQVIAGNKSNIISSGTNFGVDAQTIASVIYTEQNYNVDWVDSATDWVGIYGVPVLDTSIGVGQVKISTVKFLEEHGYFPRIADINLNLGGNYVLTAHLQRYLNLMDDAKNIDYAAAYLRYFQDTWQGAYPNIFNDHGVLGTLYNKGQYVPGTKILATPHSNPQPSQEFGVLVQQHYNAMGYLLGL
jgi:RHS repeat-associated protein